MLLVAVALAVAVAFADSSIVVLALPDLYATFNTSIEGVAWVITSFNLVVAVGALVLVLVVYRVRATVLLGAGAALFMLASIACALADSIDVLIVARSVQGLGAALLLASSLPVLGAIAGSPVRGAAIWTAAGTFGAALGPALGGVLTQAFDWRAIFVAQAPIAGVAVVAAARTRATPILREGWDSVLRRTLPANAGLALVFGALVGALFLGVLLVIDVFGFTPIQGAAIVSLIPVGALVARPIASSLPVAYAAAAGAVLLAAGLVGLALLPSSSLGYALPSFALCGFGLGLGVPGLTATALAGEQEAPRTATFTVGMRHLGLVLALAVVAPMLASDLTSAAEVAKLNGTAVVIDGRIPATTKIPLALDIRDALDLAPKGELPDFTAVFDEHGATTDPAIRQVQADLDETIARAATRGFRRSFLFCGLLAALALAPALVLRRRRAA
jgi:predicted MFS family arabinose efflux permease